jgi:RNAse (barnase) inhibitor barstar
MRTDEVIKPGLPALLLLESDGEHALAWGVEAREEEGGAVALRWLRGSRMRSLEGFHDELAAALQFPPYYGANFDALRDMLSDLEWLESEGFLFLVLEADQALADASPEAWEAFSEVVAEVAETWAEMDDVAFKVVLVAEGEGLEALRARLALGGMRAEAIELPSVN